MSKIFLACCCGKKVPKQRTKNTKTETEKVEQEFGPPAPNDGQFPNETTALNDTKRPSISGGSGKSGGGKSNKSQDGDKGSNKDKSLKSDKGPSDVSIKETGKERKFNVNWIKNKFKKKSLKSDKGPSDVSKKETGKERKFYLRWIKNKFKKKHAPGAAPLEAQANPGALTDEEWAARVQSYNTWRKNPGLYKRDLRAHSSLPKHRAKYYGGSRYT